MVNVLVVAKYIVIPFWLSRSYSSLPLVHLLSRLIHFVRSVESWDTNSIFGLEFVKLHVIDRLLSLALIVAGLVQEPSGQVAQAEARGTGTHSEIAGRSPQQLKGIGIEFGVIAGHLESLRTVAEF